jgi:hypothetical protein
MNAQFGLLLTLVLLFCSPLLGYSIPPEDQDFDWETYFARLERIQTMNILPQAFINTMGNRYLGTEDQVYHTDEAACINILKYGINDDSRVIRDRALNTAVAGNYRGIVPHLIERLRVEENKGIKKKLIWAAGKLGNEDIVLPLTQFLRNERDQELIAFLALALGRVGGTGDEIRPLLYLAENSRHLLVKCSAILGIGRLRINEGKDILWSCTSYPAHEVRFTAILSLTFLDYNESEGKDQLMDVYNRDSSIYVKLGVAYHMLKRYGYETSYVQYISRRLDDIYHRAVVLDFMQDLGYPYFVNVLRVAQSRAENRNLKAVYASVIENIYAKHQNGHS